MSTQIPNFDEHGCLPPGIYNASIDEVVKRFGGSKSLKRSQLTKNLKLFYNFARHHANEIYIDGSYTTSKLAPKDVDILIIFPKEFMNDIGAWLAFLNYRNNFAKYKLHMYGYFDGENDEDREEIFQTFTHTRRDENNISHEKGIIKLEIKT